MDEQPPRMTASLNIRMQPALVQQLEIVAEQTGVSLSDVARIALELGVGPARGAIEEAIERADADRA